MSLYQGKKPGDVPRLDSTGRDSTATVCELSSLRLKEEKIKSAMQEDRLEEAVEPESARGMMEDQWQDFSDSEEELVALELLTRAEEGLMMEYNMLKSGIAKKTPGKKEEGS